MSDSQFYRNAEYDAEIIRNSPFRRNRFTDKRAMDAMSYLEVLPLLGEEVPTNAGLSGYLGVPLHVLGEWAAESKEFARAMDVVAAEREKILINKGLSGKLNPQIVKLILAQHGYSEKQEITGPQGGPIQKDTTWKVEVVE